MKVEAGYIRARSARATSTPPALAVQLGPTCACLALLLHSYAYPCHWVPEPVTHAIGVVHVYTSYIKWRECESSSIQYLQPFFEYSRLCCLDLETDRAQSYCCLYLAFQVCLRPPCLSGLTFLLRALYTTDVCCNNNYFSLCLFAAYPRTVMKTASFFTYLVFSLTVLH